MGVVVVETPLGKWLEEEQKEQYTLAEETPLGQWLEAAQELVPACQEWLTLVLVERFAHVVEEATIKSVAHPCSC